MGAFPELTPAQARDLAQTMLNTVNGRIAASGGNKALVAQELRAAQAERKARVNAPTLDAAIDEYARTELAGTKRRDKTVKEIRSFFADYLSTQPAHLPHEKINRLIEAERQRVPSHTNTVIRRARPLFRWMQERGWTNQNILAGAKVEQSPERDVSPTAADVAQILISSEAEQSATCRGLMGVLVYTAQRLGNCMALQVGEIDRDDMVWTIPSAKAKTKTDYKTPLTREALAIIDATAAANGIDWDTCDPETYLFAGRTSKPFAGISRLKERVEKRAKDNNGGKFIYWQIHDLRRSFSDAVIDAGADPAIADRCLNHAASGTTSRIQRRYQRSQQVERQRAVFQTWASILQDELARARGEPAPRKVVSISNGRPE